MQPEQMEEYTQLRYLPVASATLASGKEVREVRRSTKVQKSRRILRPWNEVAFFDLEESAEHPPAKDDRERKNGALIGVVKPQESLSRAMAHIGFVSTSVLESKDGVRKYLSKFCALNPFYILQNQVDCVDCHVVDIMISIFRTGPEVVSQACTESL